MFELVRFLISLFVLVSSQSHGAENRQIHTGNSQIRLQSEATLVITAWAGSGRCDEGEIYLQEPAAVAVAPSKLPTRESKVIGWDMIYDHLPKTRESIVLGPYHDDTSIVFGFRFFGDCMSSFPHTSEWVRVSKQSNEHWQLSIEDSKDRDYNDLYLQVVIKSSNLKSVTGESIATNTEFHSPPTYKYPWPEGKTYTTTTNPGEGHHNGLAYDFALKMGDPIHASEKGRVLWVEDGFGEGACSQLLVSKVNVIVIQTEEGVNQNYVHLKEGSVKEAGIEVGDIVEQGQFIGRAGNSGFSCSSSGGDGAHLHIEWVKNCYNLEKAGEMRLKYKEGKPTLAWSCPAFSTDSAFSFN